MRHRVLTTGLALAGLGLCAVTGCSGGGLPAVTTPAGRNSTGLPPIGTALPSPGNPDQSLKGMHACKLVPASVVAQVLGPLLERPYETQDGLSCFYNTAVSGGGGPSYVLSIITHSGYEAAKSFAAGVAESGDKAEQYKSTHDLGDDTFSVSTDTGAPDYSLWAVKAGVGVEVNVNDLGKGVSRAHDLVATALNHL